MICFYNHRAEFLWFSWKILQIYVLGYVHNFLIFDVGLLSDIKEPIIRMFDVFNVVHDKIIIFTIKVYPQLPSKTFHLPKLVL